MNRNLPRLAYGHPLGDTDHRRRGRHLRLSHAAREAGAREQQGDQEVQGTAAYLAA